MSVPDSKLCMLLKDPLNYNSAHDFSDTTKTQTMPIQEAIVFGS